MMEVRPQSSYLVSAADVSQYLRGCKVISIRSDVCATFADVRMQRRLCDSHDDKMHKRRHHKHISRHNSHRNRCKASDTPDNGP